MKNYMLKRIIKPCTELAIWFESLNQGHKPISYYIKFNFVAALVQKGQFASDPGHLFASDLGPTA